MLVAVTVIVMYILSSQSQEHALFKPFASGGNTWSDRIEQNSPSRGIFEKYLKRDC